MKNGSIGGNYSVCGSCRTWQHFAWSTSGREGAWPACFPHAGQLMLPGIATDYMGNSLRSPSSHAQHLVKAGRWHLTWTLHDWISPLATCSLDAHLKPASGVWWVWVEAQVLAEGSACVALLMMLHDYILHSVRYSEVHYMCWNTFNLCL